MTTTGAVTSTTDTTAAAAAMKKSIGLNKDDFLKMFMAQLKYQDPLAPTDPSAILSQMSQITQVEQAYNTNTNLQNMLTAQNNASTTGAVAFIGKDVRANGNSLSFDGTNPTTMQFTLAGAAKSAQISISDANGNVVRTVATGDLTAGDKTISWDGGNNSGKKLPAGAYSFAVTPTGASGGTIASTTYTTGRIDGMTLVDGTPKLTIGSVKIGMSDIISIKGV